MAGIYAMDPTIQSLLGARTFEDQFDIKEFVSSVSENLIAQSNQEPGPFDPRPFIRNFEAAVDKLLVIRKDIQKKTEMLEQSVKNAEKDYSEKMVELNSGFEAVGKSFNSMESKITEVGRSAIRIGEQLESVHVARQRAQAAYDLFHHYNQLSRGDTSSLEALKKEGKNREGTRQVAIILRRLNVVAKEVEVPGADVTREHIEKYCEKFEKDMLKLFDRYYRKGDPKMMARCAQTLLEFNGGSSCVQMYVNQHDFFISENRPQQPDDASPLWQTLPDPYAPAPKKEPGLSAMFAQIRATVEQEAQIIQAVFPNPPIVMQVFLQRVFAQVIQQYLEIILQKSSVMSNLAFLRMLSMAHVQTAALVEDLKQHDLSATVMRSTMTAAPADPLAVGGVVATGTA
ncbi:Exocyst complex component 5, partial [Ceratobasidium sp. 394]